MFKTVGLLAGIVPGVLGLVVAFKAVDLTSFREVRTARLTVAGGPTGEAAFYVAQDRYHFWHGVLSYRNGRYREVYGITLWNLDPRIANVSRCVSCCNFLFLPEFAFGFRSKLQPTHSCASIDRTTKRQLHVLEFRSDDGRTTRLTW